MINSFRGEYEFLSNMYEIPITYKGITYRNSEAAFQAQKTLSEDERRKFANISGGTAKRMGGKNGCIVLRKDWEQIKVQEMHDIIRAKFTQNPEIAKKLIQTQNEHLEEGNTWNDRTWGTVNGQGKNLLGQILMTVREELTAQKGDIT